MNENEQFLKNLETWRVICPQDASEVENVKCDHVFLCTAESGVPNLLSKKDNQEIYLHSNVDPVAEAEKWFTGLHTKDVGVIFIYGVGLGYYYQAAKEWLKKSLNHYLVFIERDPQVIRLLLESKNGTELINDHQTALYAYPESESTSSLNHILLPYAPYNFIITSLSCLEADFNSKLKVQIGFLANMNNMTLSEYKNHGLNILGNFLKNFLILSKSYLAYNLIDKFKGVPAIICGAGPSLDKNMDVLATLGDRALIFAGGTALNALNSRGVMPHFGVGIDPNPDQFTRLVMNHAFELPFIYRLRMLHEALEMVHGDRLYVMGTNGYEMPSWMEKYLGFPSGQVIEDGFNVLNFSVSLATAMGCNPIITVGVDLAYTNGQSYASGIVSHPLHDRKSNFLTKNIQEDLLSKKDVNGNEVYTLWKWVAESMWYAMFAANHRDTTLINATEGGIGFKNAYQCTLAQARDTVLKRQYDLTTRLQGEIQNCLLPEASLPNILDGMNILSTSLEEWLKDGEQIEDLLVKKKNLDLNDPQYNSIVSEIQEKEKKIINIEAYPQILKVFDENFKSHYVLNLQRIKRDESESGKAIAQVDYDINRYRYLNLTAKLQNKVFKEVIKEQSEKIKQIEKAAVHEEKGENEQEIPDLMQLKQEYPLPVLLPNDIYSYENHVLKIIDPEMGLNYQETFIPQPNERECLYYPNGALKLEHYRQKDVLHGPSTFYHENGTILAQGWFWQGKQQGKMWTRYATGELHSLQRFLDGHWEGKQQYFYKDGLPKSIFTYSNGTLNGDVILFHSKGIKARHLHFIFGKRHGTEYIWKESGRLMIEANYLANRPVGMTRSWYPNGLLAKEILYDDHSNRLQVQAWDTSGKLLIIDPSTQEDYFDQVTSQVGTFTDALDQMVTQLYKTLPVLSDQMMASGLAKEDNEVNPAFKMDFEKIQKELDHLHALQDEMVAKSLTTEENPTEALWKTPLTQNEMERRLTQLGDQINKDLKTISSGLNDALQKILNKTKPKQD